MVRAIVLALAFAGMSFAAHAERDHETVSWFRSHPEARANIRAICQDDPGAARNSANCINAQAAEETAAIDRLVGQTDHPTMLVNQCATMPPLFQVVNHCGGSR